METIPTEKAQEKTPKEKYINDRLLQQIEYYSKESKKLQEEYYAISIVSIIVLAIIPIITLLSDAFTSFRYLIAGASAISSVLSSVLLIRKTKDNWLEYRATSEALQSELAKYNCCASVYNVKSDEERLVILVNTCEKIMSAEHNGWYARMKADSNQE